MAITGNLKSFYLSSLLQLLSNDKKTGILELTDGTDIVQVYLRNGTIINAFGSSRVDRLTNYLRSEGIITEEQLQKCMKISAHTEKKIGMVLVEQGIISPEQLENLLHRQIEQTLYSLFLWEQGEFHFRDQNFDLSGQIIASFDTMQVVLEASRRIDEISEIKKRVPTDHHLLAVNPVCSDQQKSKLNTVERAVLSLVNGKRTVKRVIADSGYDELKVYKTLFSLVTSGLILEENSALKRPENIHKEIAEPDHSNTTPIEDPVRTEDLVAADENTEPGAGIFKTPADAQPRHDEPIEPDEMILELDPEPNSDQQESGQSLSASEPQQNLKMDASNSDNTVVKINGQILPEIDFSDIEPIDTTPLEPVKKNELANALRQINLTEGLKEDDEEYARMKQRVLKISAICAIAVIALIVAVLFLKPVLFPGTPEQTSVQAPNLKKKQKKHAAQQAKKPIQQEEKQAATDEVPVQPELTSVFFQDEKGWVSINLPPGFTVSEQPYKDRTNVSIRYDDDIMLSLSIVPELAEWNAEDEMYTAIVKMQEGGKQQIQKYNTLKHLGCPGYVLHFANMQDQKSAQTALYRFVCFNKNVRLEVTSLNQRTPASRNLCQRIYAAIEESFFIYQ